MGRPLHRMFSTVPGRYDLLNRVLTLGMDQLWRREAVDEILSAWPGRVMDLCTGTGDLAIMLSERAPLDTRITAVDFVQGMLLAAGAKRDGLQRARADAGHLPFGDGCFDAVGIAFGFRNLTFRNPGTDGYLTEILRVLADGGRLVVVETSQPTDALWRAGFHAFLDVGVGRVGAAMSDSRGAYRYLAHSAREYYTADEVCDLLLSAGFDEVAHRPLMGGVAGLTVATRGAS